MLLQRQFQKFLQSFVFTNILGNLLIQMQKLFLNFEILFHPIRFAHFLQIKYRFALNPRNVLIYNSDMNEVLLFFSFHRNPSILAEFSIVHETSGEGR